MVLFRVSTRCWIPCLSDIAAAYVRIGDVLGDTPTVTDDVYVPGHVVQGMQDDDGGDLDFDFLAHLDSQRSRCFVSITMIEYALQSPTEHVGMMCSCVCPLQEVEPYVSVRGASEKCNCCHFPFRNPDSAVYCATCGEMLCRACFSTSRQL